MPVDLPTNLASYLSHVDREYVHRKPFPSHHYPRRLKSCRWYLVPHREAPQTETLWKDVPPALPLTNITQPVLLMRRHATTPANHNYTALGETRHHLPYSRDSKVRDLSSISCVELACTPSILSFIESNPTQHPPILPSLPARLVLFFRHKIPALVVTVANPGARRRALSWTKVRHLFYSQHHCLPDALPDFQYCTRYPYHTTSRRRRHRESTTHHRTRHECLSPSLSLLCPDAVLAWPRHPHRPLPLPKNVQASSPVKLSKAPTAITVYAARTW